MHSFFSCPICGQPLTRTAGQYLCPAHHSFDIAKEGYVNLLPANRQHSKSPGDDGDMVASRAVFLNAGWYAPLQNKLCQLIDELSSSPALLDAGCGEGYYTAAMAQTVAAKGGRTAGVDLSKAAVKRAAKQCREGEFAVASVYHLPVADRAVDMLVDCFSPLAAGEFHRVLKPGGKFLYVVPGPKHLWELKQTLYDTPYENEEKEELYPGFRYLSVVPVETSFTLSDQPSIQALFGMTPYAWKTPQAGIARLKALKQLPVTAQFRIHCLEKI